MFNKRKKINKRKSRKVWKKGNKTKGRNVSPRIMRGGYRI